MLNFDKENKTEVRIYDYLTERCKTDKCLKDKLDSTSKTIAGAIGYCNEEARKLVTNGSNCIAIDDDTVFEWCVHYFLEDDLKENETPKPKKEPKKEESKPAPKKEPNHPAITDKKKDYEQLRFF